jgi:hypothetical protein
LQPNQQISVIRMTVAGQGLITQSYELVDVVSVSATEVVVDNLVNAIAASEEAIIGTWPTRE